MLFAVSNTVSLLISASYLERSLPRPQFAALTASLGLTSQTLYGESPYQSLCNNPAQQSLTAIAGEMHSSADLVGFPLVCHLAIILSGGRCGSFWRMLCPAGKSELENLASLLDCVKCAFQTGFTRLSPLLRAGPACHSHAANVAALLRCQLRQR